MIPKGTRIVCLGCGKVIYVTEKDIRSGDKAEASQFADAGYGSPEPGERAVCPVCDYDIKPSVEKLL